MNDRDWAEMKVLNGLAPAFPKAMKSRRPQGDQNHKQALLAHIAEALGQENNTDQ